MFSGNLLALNKKEAFYKLSEHIFKAHFVFISITFYLHVTFGMISFNLFPNVTSLNDVAGLLLLYYS